MDDLIVEFVSETLESLAMLDQELVKFEQTPDDKAILGNVFRMMHTIKGTCGFLGLPRLEKVAHAGEDVLGKFRDGGLQPSPQSVTLVLSCIDKIRAIVTHISEHGGEGEDDDSELIAQLRATASGTAIVPVAAAPVVDSAPAGPTLSAEGFPVAAEFLAEFEAVAAPAPVPAPVPEVAGEPAPEPAKLQPLVGLAPVGSEMVPKDFALKLEPKVEPHKDKAPAQTIRVSVDVLENLMTLVSEMVLTRNQLLQLTRNADDSVFKDPIERLSRTTSELQEGVMKTRMQPIGNAWGKLPRIVRDLSNELNKKINLVMFGEETELDRQVLELIQDPLTHMVRNSADHGLEQPADRKANGKDETGTIRLSAFHEGGHIIIQIVDDGRGINTAKVREKIIERGLASSAEVAAMDDNTVNQYIMRAGFSTAEKVTKVSGRGVGMDVVRSNIERIGGTIEFFSVFGKGSTFTIKIPLTLAIVSSLIVVAGQERFALPQIAVNEVVRVSERSEHRIESLKGSPLLRLRERLLPLVNLRQILALDDDETCWQPGRNNFSGYVVVCRNGSHVMGVIVDSISDAEEIVVKPLSPILGATRYFSGNTILGDGRVILILDVNGLASSLSQDAVQAQAAEVPAELPDATAQNILLFRTMQEGLKAVPLSQVQRIENIDMATTEVTQGEVVVQYRDRLLPILSFDGLEGVRRTGNQQVLVFGQGAGAVGLAIDSIVDIARDALVTQKPSRQSGLIGSAVIAGRAADIIDPEFFLRQSAALASGTVPQLGAAA